MGKSLLFKILFFCLLTNFYTHAQILNTQEVLDRTEIIKRNLNYPLKESLVKESLVQPNIQKLIMLPVKEYDRLYK